MDQQAQIFPVETYEKAALPKVSVRIRGLPADVQRIADAIDLAVAGAMSWQDLAHEEANYLIEVGGNSDNA